MAISLKQLQNIVVNQLKKRGYYPASEFEILLHLGEEVGEVMEAVREKQDVEHLSMELADVLWHVLRLAALKEIDMEHAFLRKLNYNETRPLDSTRS